MFGRSERVTACACERSGDVTLPQLLHLQNSDNLTARIRRRGTSSATACRQRVGRRNHQRALPGLRCADSPAKTNAQQSLLN
ncbi:MAG UNVERIFIED_CONTAM: hypothetical protein LVR18_26310 [Planctomycetaceae bacterium]